MISRLAHAYVWFLLTLEILLFTLSLLLHGSLLMGMKEPFAEYGGALFRGTVLVAIPVGALVRRESGWRNQIKSCPAWIWKSVLIICVYGVVVTCLEEICINGGSITRRAFAFSGFPLSVDAISICILVSIGWRRYLTESELARAAGTSLAMIACEVIMQVAYHAGLSPS